MAGNATVSPAAAARHIDLWPDMVARVGYLAKGVVYITVGVLAVLVAIGRGGETGGSKNAITQLLQAPYGFALVVVLTLGLLCYALWRWTQALADPEHPGPKQAKDWGRRGVYLVSAVLYSSLTAWAVSLLVGSASSGEGENSSEQWSATLLGHTGGRWLLGTIGTVIVVAGAAELAKVIKQSFTDKMALHRLRSSMRKTVKGLGNLGLSARAVVFWIIGGSLIYTAWTANPEQAESFGSALSSLRTQPYGWWLFATVSFGVVAYGAFQVAKGWLRRINA